MTSSPVIAGIDEAGRGPLAGPVVAAACIITHEMYPRESFGWKPMINTQCKDALHGRLSTNNVIIGDSKMLSEEQRETAYTWIIEHCAYGIGTSSAAEIDQLGILGATEQAMQQAVEQLKLKQEPTYLLVDGCDAFWFNYPHSSVIRGDSLEPCIAAASILAKVTRDRWMKEQHELMPHYGFAQHKGYGAPQHLEALRQHGPCALHRQTFLKKFFEREALAAASVTLSKAAELT